MIVLHVRDSNSLEFKLGAIQVIIQTIKNWDCTAALAFGILL